jgi:uncharacterized iron-regulated protein
MRPFLAVAALMLAGGCAAVLPLPELAGVDALLVGEQHDARSHAHVQERWVATLARQGRLGAVALEMADRGTSTAGLPATASEQDVRQALGWQQEGWPWERYAPAVMAAVKAGVPVVGANLPRTGNRQAMRDPMLDRLLPEKALAAQQEAVRAGHCDMLPAQQIAPMTRIQIARDVAMAQTVASLVRPGKTVVLLAGAGHVREDVGVPLHLPPGVSRRAAPLPAEETGRDYCAEFRAQMPKRG